MSVPHPFIYTPIVFSWLSCYMTIITISWREFSRRENKIKSVDGWVDVFSTDFSDGKFNRSCHLVELTWDMLYIRIFSKHAILYIYKQLSYVFGNRIELKWMIRRCWNSWKNIRLLRTDNEYRVVWTRPKHSSRGDTEIIVNRN